MYSTFDSISKLIGDTRLYQLDFPTPLYTKLEFQNLFGSIKDRPALFIIKQCLQDGIINKDTIVIESTSGNFGIALASICRALGIRFIPVIDPNISRQKEQLLRLISHAVIKVTEKDQTGGYLLNRIRTVKEFVRNNPNCYNPNQYENPCNYLSYFYTLGVEICNSFDRLDYLFISVSSGGTIIGLSRRLKEKFPDLTVVAVDVEGSMIFDDKQMVRKLPGIGASMRSPLFDKASIDRVVILSQTQIVEGAYELLKEQALFVGPSAAAAYVGAKICLKDIADKDAVSLFISPDHGSSYLDTVYNPEWVQKNIFSNIEVHEVFE